MELKEYFEINNSFITYDEEIKPANLNDLSDEGKKLLEENPDYLGRYLLHDREAVNDIAELAEAKKVSFEIEKPSYPGANKKYLNKLLLKVHNWAGDEVTKFRIPICDLSLDEEIALHRITDNLKDKGYNRDYEYFSDVYGLAEELKNSIIFYNKAVESKDKLPVIRDEGVEIGPQYWIIQEINKLHHIEHWADNHYNGNARELDPDLSRTGQWIQEEAAKLRNDLANLAVQRGLVKDVIEKGEEGLYIDAQKLDLTLQGKLYNHMTHREHIRCDAAERFEDIYKDKLYENLSFYQEKNGVYRLSSFLGNDMNTEKVFDMMSKDPRFDGKDVVYEYNEKELHLKDYYPADKENGRPSYIENKLFDGISREAFDKGREQFKIEQANFLENDGLKKAELRDKYIDMLELADKDFDRKEQINMLDSLIYNDEISSKALDDAFAIMSGINNGEDINKLSDMVATTDKDKYHFLDNKYQIVEVLHTLKPSCEELFKGTNAENVIDRWYEAVKDDRNR